MRHRRPISLAAALLALAVSAAPVVAAPIRVTLAISNLSTTSCLALAKAYQLDAAATYTLTLIWVDSLGAERAYGTSLVGISGGSTIMDSFTPSASTYGRGGSTPAVKWIVAVNRTSSPASSNIAQSRAIRNTCVAPTP